MKKTKRRALYIVAALLAALFVLSCLVGFAACGGDSGNEDACADGHTWDAGVETTAATCTTAGVKTYTCTVCGETKTETIAALGHTLVKTDAVSATCTTGGNNAYWTCSVCKKVFSDEAGTSETSVEQQTIGKLSSDGKHSVVGTYANNSWSYACSVCNATIDLTTDAEAIASVTLQASDATSLAAAATWNAISGMVPTVVVQSDIALSSALTVTGQIVLDLAGNTLSSAEGETDETTGETTGGWTATEADSNGVVSDVMISVASGAKLTIKDSSTDGSGEISYEYEGSSTTYNSTPFDWNTSVNYGSAIQTAGTLVLESGTISSSSVGVKADGGSVTIGGGAIESAYFSVWVRGTSTVTINGGTISGEKKGILVAGGDGFGGYTRDDSTSIVSTLTVTGGTISCEGDSAISTLGNTPASQKVVTISGGTITGPDLYDEETQTGTPMPAIYNGTGTLTISGGEITGSTAVEHRGGSLTISGGTLTSSYEGTQNTPAYKDSGATGYGYALVIAPFSKSGNSSNPERANDMTVSVTNCAIAGDVYISQYAKVRDGQDESITASISISGMTISGKIVLAENSALNLADILGENITVVVSAEEQLRWAVTIPGVTVCMNADITLESSELTISVENVTLDLNGHALKDTSSNSNTQVIAVRGTVESPASLTIKDSSEGTGSIVGVQYGIFVVGEVNTGVENTTAGGGTATATLTVEGGKIEGTAGAAISTNGQNKNNGHTNTYNRGGEVINIRGGEIVSTQSVGIYLPNGTLNVSGGTISGTTGIEVRAGKVTITGGAVSTTVTGGSSSIGTGTNGPISSGYAIAVIDSTSSYNAIVSVSIGSGVTLNGDIYSDVIVDAEENEVVTVAAELGLIKVAYDTNGNPIEEANLGSATVDHYVYTTADAGEET